MPNVHQLRNPALHFVAPAEWVVLDLLLEREPGDPYSVGEIARTIGSVAHTADALATLETAGLIRRSRELVRLTPPNQTTE
jgi:DNA-binding MarR family transcriptional regulator